MLIGVFGRKRKDDEDEEVQYQAQYQDEDEEGRTIKRRRALRIASLIPAIGAIILFILTQDMSQPMVIFDWWSIVFAIIAGVNIILLIASHKKKEDDDEDDSYQQTVNVPTMA